MWATRLKRLKLQQHLAFIRLTVKTAFKSSCCESERLKIKPCKVFFVREMPGKRQDANAAFKKSLLGRNLYFKLAIFTLSNTSNNLYNMLNFCFQCRMKYSPVKSSYLFKTCSYSTGCCTRDACIIPRCSTETCSWSNISRLHLECSIDDKCVLYNLSHHGGTYSVFSTVFLLLALWRL